MQSTRRKGVIQMSMMDWFRSFSARLGQAQSRVQVADPGARDEQIPTSAGDESTLTDQDLAQVQGGISSIQISSSGGPEVIPVE